MNRDQLEGRWEQVKGQIQEKWGKLTDDDLTAIHGKQSQLLGKLQERYGYTVERANSEFGTFMRDCDCGTSDAKKPKPEARI